jgi:hypothetical protein
MHPRYFISVSKWAFAAVFFLLVAGCSEPYPAWSVTDISIKETPRAVMGAFRRDFPDAHISKVERSTFESRMSGRPQKYRIFFAKSGGESQRAIYDSAGQRADRFDFWFGRRGTNHRPAGESDAR